MRDNQDAILQNHINQLELRIKSLTNENSRLKQINRRLQGKQNRRGAPEKFVNFLDLYGTIPSVMNRDIPAPRLVKDEKKRLENFLGKLSDRSMVNAIYKHRKKISPDSSKPTMTDAELGTR